MISHKFKSFFIVEKGQNKQMLTHPITATVPGTNYTEPQFPVCHIVVGVCNISETIDDE